MVHSACDACQVLAEAVSGSVEAFVDIFRNKLVDINYEQLTDIAYKYAKDNFSIGKMQREYEAVYNFKIKM